MPDGQQLNWPYNWGGFITDFAAPEGHQMPSSFAQVSVVNFKADFVKTCDGETLW